MKKTLCLVLCLILAIALFSGCGQDSTADFAGVTLRLNHTGNAAAPLSQAYMKAAEAITEKTDGKVTVEVYLDGQLADQKTSLVMVMDGSIDIAGGGGPQWMETYVPEISFAAAPFLYNSAEHLIKVLRSDFFLDMVKEFEEDTDTSIKRIKRNLDAVKGCAYSANVVTLPFYYPVRDKEEQLNFIKAVCALSDKPLILYNIPNCVHAAYDLDVVKEVSAWDQIAGLKDSGADDAYLDEALKLNRDGEFHVVLGREFVCARAYRLGARGCVASLANAYPELFTKQYRAARAGDFDTVDAIQAILDEINSFNKRVKSAVGPMYLRKRLLSKLGLCGTEMTQPFIMPDGQLLAEFDLKTDALIARMQRGDY